MLELDVGRRPLPTREALLHLPEPPAASGATREAG
jgi:hypothetical protein